MEGHRLNGSRLVGLLTGVLASGGTPPAPVEYERDEVLFREGGSAGVFYVIERGRVRLEVSTPGRPTAVIQTIGPGDLVGLSWFGRAGGRWSWDARAIMDTRALSFDAAAVRAACADDAALRADVASCVADEAIRRLHAARLQLVDLFGRAS
jgi:CRP/FNR family cyclic AMP-dependent transcriptional regulator